MVLINSWLGENKEVHTFSESNCPGVNIIDLLEFELTHCNVAVQHTNHAVMSSSPFIFDMINKIEKKYLKILDTYMYIYLWIQSLLLDTHTHTHIYIYIYIAVKKKMVKMCIFHSSFYLWSWSAGEKTWLKTTCTTFYAVVVESTWVSPKNKTRGILESCNL